MCDCHRWVCDECCSKAKDYEVITIGGPLLLDPVCFVCGEHDRDLSLITRRVAEALRLENDMAAAAIERGDLVELPAAGITSQFIAVFNNEEEARQAVTDAMRRTSQNP